jgi:shikimate dehydrogenase
VGAGGAARAIVLALARMGAPEIRILNRTPSRAEALARHAAQTMHARAVRAYPWSGSAKALAGAGLLVNTTSLGMTGKEALRLDLDGLPPDAAIADIVYNPLETLLLRTARVRGHRTMDGLGMLMHQAIPAFAAWYGVTPEVTPALRAKLVAALADA